MICDQCGHTTQVLQTRVRNPYIVERRRECKYCAKRFSTKEVQASFFDLYRPYADAWLRGAAKRVELWNRDIWIAKHLHYGWNVIAEKFNLAQNSVYSAAKRGRSHMLKIRRKKDGE